MRNDPRNLMPGDRVLVFDSILFKDDVSTPLTYTVRPATIVRRYGSHGWWGFTKTYIQENRPNYEVWKYPDLVDVLFDHRPERVSHGHFTDGVKDLKIHNDYCPCNNCVSERWNKKEKEQKV